MEYKIASIKLEVFKNSTTSLSDVVVVVDIVDNFAFSLMYMMNNITRKTVAIPNRVKAIL